MLTIKRGVITGRESQRWGGRPVAAGALRALILLVPLAVGLGVAWGLSPLLPAPASTAALIGEWLLLVAVSTAAIVLAERAVRRLAPLAVLLKLSLLFPGPAPSRFRVALRAGSVRTLHERLLEGTRDDPSRAAELILSLASAISAHDRRTRGHSERVRAYAEMLGEELGVEGEELERLRWAALLHDVGKLRVPAPVLNKDGSPDRDEWELIHRHPIEGARLAAPLMNWLGPWGLAIQQHHEHFDGSGYPEGLAGQDISLAARVVSVSDAYETMTAARSYHQPMTPHAARQELARCGGTHFDPEVVRAFLNLSVARLRRVAGPLVGLAGLPLLRPWRRLATQPAASTVGAAGVAALAAFTSLGALQPTDHASPPPAPMTAETQGGQDRPPRLRTGDEQAAGTTERRDRSPTSLPTSRPTSRDTPTLARTSGAFKPSQTQMPGRTGRADLVGGSAAPDASEPVADRTTEPVRPRPEPAVPRDTDEAEAPPQQVQDDAPSADKERKRKGKGKGRRNRLREHPDPPPHASADPAPDTAPGDGADPDPHGEEGADRDGKPEPGRGRDQD